MREYDLNTNNKNNVYFIKTTSTITFKVYNNTINYKKN